MLTFCDVSVMARCDVIFVLDLYPQLDVLTGDPSANGGGLGFFSSEAVEAEGAAHLLLCREAVMRRLRRSSLFFFPSTSSPRLLFAASVFFL